MCGNLPESETTTCRTNEKNHISNGPAKCFNTVRRTRAVSHGNGKPSQHSLHAGSQFCPSVAKASWPTPPKARWRGSQPARVRGRGRKRMVGVFFPTYRARGLELIEGRRHDCDFVMCLSRSRKGEVVKSSKSLTLARRVSKGSQKDGWRKERREEERRGKYGLEMDSPS